MTINFNPIPQINPTKPSRAAHRGAGVPGPQFGKASSGKSNSKDEGNFFQKAVSWISKNTGLDSLKELTTPNGAVNWVVKRARDIANTASTFVFEAVMAPISIPILLLSPIVLPFGMDKANVKFNPDGTLQNLSAFEKIRGNISAKVRKTVKPAYNKILGMITESKWKPVIWFRQTVLGPQHDTQKTMMAYYFNSRFTKTARDTMTQAAFLAEKGKFEGEAGQKLMATLSKEDGYLKFISKIGPNVGHRLNSVFQSLFPNHTIRHTIVNRAIRRQVLKDLTASGHSPHLTADTVKNLLARHATALTSHQEIIQEMLQTLKKSDLSQLSHTEVQTLIGKGVDKTALDGFFNALKEARAKAASDFVTQHLNPALKSPWRVP
jgi:hypothetical protein